MDTDDVALALIVSGAAMICCALILMLPVWWKPRLTVRKDIEETERTLTQARRERGEEKGAHIFDEGRATAGASSNIFGGMGQG